MINNNNNYYILPMQEEEEEEYLEGQVQLKEPGVLVHVAMGLHACPSLHSSISFKFNQN